MSHQAAGRLLDPIPISPGLPDPNPKLQDVARGYDESNLPETGSVEGSSGGLGGAKGEIVGNGKGKGKEKHSGLTEGDAGGSPRYFWVQEKETADRLDMAALPENNLLLVMPAYVS